MKNKTFLITRPRHDLITTYFHHWSKKLIDLAGKKGANVIDLQHKKVNKRELTGRLAKTRPHLIILNGHGNPLEVTGHDNTELITPVNAHVLKDAIVYARSCDSAMALGQIAVSQGARAYIGYLQPFYTAFNLDKTTHPLSDELAALFLEPSNHVAVSLMKGHSAGDSSKRSKNLSQKKVQQLTSSQASPEDLVYAKYLWSNMQSQICHGDKDATV